MMPPDSSVNLKVLRNGGTRELTVKLGELAPPKGERASAETPKAGSGLEGVAVENLTPQVARRLGLPASAQGVVVTDISPASPVAGSGLREGDVIQEVNRKPVRNLSDYQQVTRDAGKEPLLLVNRHGNTFFVAA